MISFELILFFAVAGFVAYCKAESKTVCYYDSKSHFRQGQGKFEISDIEPALQYCTHLIYGYAAINEETFKLIPLNEQFDVIENNYRKVTDLKKRYPELKVLLSVGGNADVSDEDFKNKYKTLLESTTHRVAFVNSAYTILKAYGFDGLDLAWEFPENKPKKVRSALGSFWHKIRNKISVGAGPKVIDENAENHRQQFVSLVRELRSVFKAENLLVTLTVLPNVKSTVFYDPRALAPDLDFITLEAFDFYTPQRNPQEADFPAPLYELLNRKFDRNVDYQVSYWLKHGAPNNKLILGIPTYGRAWKIDSDTPISGVPPLSADYPTEAGPYSKQEGLLSYTEVCVKLANPQKLQTSSGKRLRKVGDPSKTTGTYAFRVPDENEEGGIWVGYEDPDTAGNKASYVKAKGLGGVAIVDITLDDFRGLCTGDKYPIVRAAKFRL